MSHYILMLSRQYLRNASCFLIITPMLPMKKSQSGTEGLRGVPMATQNRWLGPKSPD